MSEHFQLISSSIKEKGSQELLPFLSQAALLEGILSNADRQQLQQQLWLLLGQRTERFTTGDSSSVPVEIAQELLSSIYFTVGLSLKADGDLFKSAVELKHPSGLSDLFQKGQAQLAEQFKTDKKLLKQVLKTALPIDNISYHSTLKEIECFFQNYDARFFAHEIPCTIDYPLCHEIPDLQGIEYIHAYLQRLLIENDFCGRFDNRQVLLLLQAYCHDYKEELINLFEPIAVNAIGLSLLSANAASLHVTHADRADLQRLFGGLTRGETVQQLKNAADALCDRLSITEPDSREYLQQTAMDLLPRINLLKGNGGFDNLFFSLHEPEDVASETQFYDGNLMDDDKLRDLIDEVRDCDCLSGKVALVKERVSSVRDLTEVLNICFWGEECFEVFSMLHNAEIAVLLYEVAKRRELSADWRSDSQWEVQLERYALTLDEDRKAEITSILKSNDSI